MHHSQENSFGKNKGAIENSQVIFFFFCDPKGKPILPKGLLKWEAIMSHGPCHDSTGGMAQAIEQPFAAYVFNNYSKKFVQCV